MNQKIFHEALPVAERRVYREEPVYADREHDRVGLSGWAILGLILLGLVLMLMLFGRGGLFGPTVNRTINTPSTNTTAR